MNMMDKEVEFRYIPMTRLQIGDTPVYYVGERNPIATEYIVEGTP